MKKALSVALSFTMAASMLAGCGGTASGTTDSGSADASGSASGSAAAEAAPEGGEGSLTIGTLSVNGGFDHVGTHGQSDDMNTYLAWGYLFRQDPETGEPVPDMVDSYEWVDDTHLQLTLKEGITAADGEEITGEDALYSIKRYYDENSNLLSFVSQYDWDNCTVSEDDPLTFTLAYTEAFGPGLRYLYLPIVAKDWAESEGQDDAV